jgi:hypothetical protein
MSLTRQPPDAGGASAQVAANRMIRIPTPSVNLEKDKFKFDNEVGGTGASLNEF